MTSDAPRQPAEHLFAVLRRLKIDWRCWRHPPLFTVADALAQRRLFPDQQQGHTKNLLLTNHHGQLWLLTCRESLKLDLGRLAVALNSSRLSFASGEALRRTLAVERGAVTPLALMHDHCCEVRFILDRALLDAARLYVHPLLNSMTIALAPSDLLLFLDKCAHKPLLLAMDSLSRS